MNTDLKHAISLADQLCVELAFDEYLWGRADNLRHQLVERLVPSEVADAFHKELKELEGQYRVD